MNGIINILKPPGMTSNGVVLLMRRLLNIKKIGHTGTLDPAAAGVLPICVGKATRLSDYIMNHQKSYIAEALFGVATDTLDTYGTVTQKESCSISEQEILKVLDSFRGPIKQQAPMYSAVKYNGKRLYEIARKGITVEKPAREVTIFELDLLGQIGKNRFLFHVVCSKGTYIRTLISDIAARLGTCACTSFLLRTSSGGFKIDNAYTVDDIKQMTSEENFGFLLPPESALIEMPAIHLGKAWLKNLLNGVPVPCEHMDVPHKIYCGELIGIGVTGNDGLKISVPLCERREWNN